MLGPPEDKGDTYSEDPFLVCLVDYQRRFGDELAGVLSAVVMIASRDESLDGKLGSFIDHNRTKIDLSSEEVQDCASLRDIQYLLGYLLRNSAVLADYLGMETEYLRGVVGDLLEVRNELAHGLYKREGYERESEKTEKFIRRGIDFIGRIIAKNQEWL